LVIALERASGLNRVGERDGLAKRFALARLTQAIFADHYRVAGSVHDVLVRNVACSVHRDNRHFPSSLVVSDNETRAECGRVHKPGDFSTIL
jgi:hypothetical protein